MYRAGARRRKGGGRSRSGSGSGLIRAITSPVGAVLLGLLVVLGVGYWVQNYRKEPVVEKKDPPAVSAPQAEAPKPSAPAAQAPAVPANSQPKPAEQPPVDPAKEIAEKRAHIDRSSGAAKTALLTVYYADGLKTTDTLQPVEVRVEQTPSQVKRVAELIVSAPDDLKLYSGVPAGTKVLSVDYNSTTGVATVDLSSELSKAQPGDVAKIKAAFVYSLTRIPNVKSVQLKVNGYPAVLHQQEWSKPITPAELDAQKLFQVEPVVKFK